MGCGCGCTQKQNGRAVQSEFSGFEYVTGEMEGGQPKPSPARATYRLECPGGCTPVIASQCEATLRQAILDAIAIANNAVLKLTAAQLDSETRRLFTFFMGHDPSRPIPWANNEESRVSVAKRLHSVARELGGGRRTLYRCVCPPLPPGVVANAVTMSPTEVRLCPPFWGASPQRGLSPRFFRAGVILHEMLHQLYLEFILHDRNERRRNNAHCYEALAMRLAGHAADQADVRQCRPPVRTPGP